MAGTLLARLPFFLVVALVAAGVGDSIVESSSNAGMFGGHYVDNNHLGVIPTLLAGCLIALQLVVRRCGDVWRHSTDPGRDRLIDVARDIGARSAGRDFPIIFALQLGWLFALESTEQLIAGGKLLGGTTWLGGPILISIVAHLTIGGLCALGLGACMRAVVRTFAAIVQTAVRFSWLAVAGGSANPIQLGRRTKPRERTQALYLRQFGGRAPPLRRPACAT